MSLTESKSYVQFKYCSLCRISCKKFKKHVHSQVHQKIVKNIIAKFSKKVSDAKAYLDEPVVKEVSWSAAEKQLWCYFCQLDVSRHLRKTTMMGECVVLDGGFLGHMTGEEHVENTKKFLKGNLIDMTRTPEFILSSGIFLKFLEKVEKACNDFFTQRQMALKKVAVSIEAQNIQRRRIVAQGLLEQSLSQQSRVPSTNTLSLPVESRRVKSKDGEEAIGKKTVRAFGIGLTAVERTNEDDTQGNIYTNALPPWLQADTGEETDKNRAIGPTLVDFQKHKKLEIKNKLPACRVGAKFDRTANQSDDWLPNFGGVWSHGPRTKSGQQFHRRHNHQLPSNFKIQEQEEKTTKIGAQHQITEEDAFTIPLPFSQLEGHPVAAQHLSHGGHSSSFPSGDWPSESGSHISMHLRVSTSHNTAEYNVNPELLYQGSDNLFSQGIRPYVSKRKRKSTIMVPESNRRAKFQHLPPGFQAPIASNVSEECSSFSSSLNEGHNSTFFPPMKGKNTNHMHPHSTAGNPPFEKHSPYNYYNSSIQLLPTPVLHAKKK